MWSRLGSPLSADFVRTDGSRYASATGYEFEEAVSAWRTQGRPRILAYRKTAPMVLDDDPAPVTMLVVDACSDRNGRGSSLRLQSRTWQRRPLLYFDQMVVI